MKNKIHRILGNIIGAKYRKWYYKNHDAALWGVIDYIENDTKKPHKTFKSGWSMEDFNDMVKSMNEPNEPQDFNEPN